MAALLIGLGSNLGNVRESMFAAKRLLGEAFGVRGLSCSHLYRTPAIGGPAGQGDFLNAVIRVDSQRSPWEIWEIIKQIESQLGRERQTRWESRRIDIDLLLHDQHRIWTPRFKVPHPRMCMRSFVLEPATEVAPDLRDPVTGWSITDLSEHLRKTSGTRSPILVLCENGEQLDLLFKTFTNSIDVADVWVQWDLLENHFKNNAWQIQCIDHLAPKLIILAVQSPGAASIPWEDQAMSWALQLNLASESIESSSGIGELDGPRYLLPMNDVTWAVHEIVAAGHAMNCSVQRSESFED